ncbi:hypothetical protein HYU14_00030 [Candidatus Woesearchaeota archaeon]|nr:hypothetical protein [Candidatus Woesearchaeota archaeon]
MKIFHFSDWWLTLDQTMGIFAFSERIPFRRKAILEKMRQQEHLERIPFRRKAILEKMRQQSISKSDPSDRGIIQRSGLRTEGEQSPNRKSADFLSSVNYFIIYEPSVTGGGRIFFERKFQQHRRGEGGGLSLTGCPGRAKFLRGILTVEPFVVEIFTLCSLTKGAFIV